MVRSELLSTARMTLSRVRAVETPRMMAELERLGRLLLLLLLGGPSGLAESCAWLVSK